jgi:HlyD family secretion protein
MTLGRLEDLTITVYVPEDQYGQIHLGQNASVQVDSYPGASFSAAVSQIAGQAEFTPRNVQTTDSRKTTVFAVTLSLQSGLNQLKPGMPADVTFTSAD